ncbi:MAG: YggS family pyridoxal phosphate-dependent enzyme [Oscillospiraceae bacterium]
MTENTCSIQDNIKVVFENVNDACIKSSRNFGDISIMGVSKTKSIEDITKAIKGGIKLFGENKVQELVEKDIVFKENNLPCHIIGSLQSNKVKFLPPLTDYIQSVDSLKLAQEIDKQYCKAGKIANILLEVNIGKEESKGGIAAESLEELLYAIAELKSVRVKGLMCIPPICQNDLVRRYFAEMNKLFIDISHKKVDNVNMNVLSMGMSHDYMYAIQEGSTLVRIGQGVFGQRDYNKI